MVLEAVGKLPDDARWKDPIVDEVRTARNRRAARLNYNVDAIFADARSREGKSGHKMVSQVVKRKKKAV